MKAEIYSLVDFVWNIQHSFDIPEYQREYVWDKKNIERLLNDIKDFIEMPEDIRDDEYSVGAILFLQSTKELSLKRFSIIDGQQRITTLILIIIALRDTLAEILTNSLNYGEMSNNEQIKNLYVEINTLVRIDPNFKSKNLWKINGFDEHNIINRMINNEKIVDDKSRFYQNYLDAKKWFLKQVIKNNKSHFGDFITKFWNEGLTKVVIVAITLNPKSNVYAVFESFNSKGKPLTSAELIKNLLLSLNQKEKDNFSFSLLVKKLYDIINNIKFGYGTNDDKIDITKNFFRQYLAINTGILESEKNVYIKFNKYIEELNKSNYSNDDIINDLIKYAYLTKYIYENLFNDLITNFNDSYNIYRPLIHGNFLNFFSIIYAVLDKELNYPKQEITINDIENIDNVKFCLKYLSQYCVTRALNASGRVESNRKYVELAFKLYKSDINIRTSFQQDVIDQFNNQHFAYRFINLNEIKNKYNINISNNQNVIKQIFFTIEEYLEQKIIDNSFLNNYELKNIIDEKSVESINSDLMSYINTVGNKTIISKRNDPIKFNSVIPLKEKNEIGIINRYKEIINFIEQVWFK